MALDPEMKAAVSALSDGQAKLIEGQVRHDAALSRHEELLVKLGEGQARLTEHVDTLTGRMDTLTGRMDTLTEHVTRSAVLINTLAEGQTQLFEQAKRTDARIAAFTEVVVRGFTDNVARDHVLEGRLDAVEERVGDLERK